MLYRVRVRLHFSSFSRKTIAKWYHIYITLHWYPLRFLLGFFFFWYFICIGFHSRAFLFSVFPFSWSVLFCSVAPMTCTHNYHTNSFIYSIRSGSQSHFNILSRESSKKYSTQFWTELSICVLWAMSKLFFFLFDAVVVATFSAQRSSFFCPFWAWERSEAVYILCKRWCTRYIFVSFVHVNLIHEYVLFFISSSFFSLGSIWLVFRLLFSFFLYFIISTWKDGISIHRSEFYEKLLKAQEKTVFSSVSINQVECENSVVGCMLLCTYALYITIFGKNSENFISFRFVLSMWWFCYLAFICTFRLLFFLHFWFAFVVRF